MALFSLVTASGTSIALDGANGVVVEQAYGLGMPPINNQSTDYAVLDGASWQRQRATARVMMLQLAAVGTSLDGANGLHTIRAKLVNAVNPHRLGSTAMKLNYTGNTDGTRYLNCRYEAGLEGGDMAGFTEKLTLRLLATDPFWYASTGASSTAPTKEAMVLDEIASWTDGVWSSMGGGADPATSATGVRLLIAKPGGGVYAAGGFNTMGGVAAANIAVLASATTSTWAALGAGITGTASEVYTGAVAPNGDLYLGGAFNRAGGTAAMRVAVRDVSAGAWAALGAGVPGLTRACAVGNAGLVYFSGAWSTAGSTAAARVAKWNGANWAAMGAGFAGGYAFSMAVDAANNLYAGGTFTTAGGAAAARIAKWNGTVWSTLGAGMPATVYDLAYDDAAGYLYAGGAFHTAGGVTVNHVARWDGQQWEPLDSGMNGDVYRMVKLSNGWLIVSGSFTTAGGRTVRNMALWNGYSWVSLPAMLNSTVYNFAEDASSGAWYFGGIFDGSQTVSGRKILTNAGSARAYPVITVVASAASQRLLYIRNDTTDQTLWFDYALQDGETLTIDCRPGAKRMTSSFYGERVGDNPLPGSQLATFGLNPGANHVSTLVDGASATITLSWTPAYWGGD